MIMYEIIFVITIVLVAAASTFAIAALHGGHARHRMYAKRFFYIAFASFLLTGIIRYYPFGLRDFIAIVTNIWGHMYLTVFFLLLFLVYLQLSRWEKQWIPISAVLLPFSCVVCVLSFPFISSIRTMETGVANHLLPFHVIFALSGELFFLLSAAGSLLALYLAYRLKDKSSFKSIAAFPSLEAFESFNLWSSSRAFFFLSIGILMGIALVWINFRTVSLLSFKELVMYLSWIFVGALFMLRKKKILPRNYIGIITVALFITITALFVASNFFREAGFHSFR
jgi:hypothetical protein